MISTPFLMRFTEWVQKRIPDADVDHEGPEFSPEANAVVVGYGRFGQTVAQMLQAKRIPVTLIDSKPSQIELSQEFGTKVYYGDGTRVDVDRIDDRVGLTVHLAVTWPEFADVHPRLVFSPTKCADSRLVCRPTRMPGRVPLTLASSRTLVMRKIE